MDTHLELTGSQTYSASIACTLPVLMSAIRRSPPSDGPAHDGKEIGKDVVTYTYEQVCSHARLAMAILLIMPDLSRFLSLPT